jgi:ribosome maturation factor RimP
MRERRCSQVSVADRVRDLVLPLLDDRHLELYDVEMQGPVLRVVVDSLPEDTERLDLDVLADATRAMSRALDEADPITGHYTLEVSSPGLERSLRRPEHFERAVGETIKVRTISGVSDERRVTGALAAADADGITLCLGTDDDGAPIERRLAYDDIERARTVFEWGPAPRPGGPRKRGPQQSDEKRDTSR